MSSGKKTATLGGTVLSEGRTKVIAPATAEALNEIAEQTTNIAKLDR